jgi:LmbE family N-acetylglucosaminyl deacetylase
MNEPAASLSFSQQELRIMVVVAHPHDFTHCAGTCGIHTERGDRVTVVTLTSGKMKHNERLYDELIKPADEQDPKIVNQSYEDYAKEKAKELRAVCGLFGVTDVRVHRFREPYRMDKVPESVEALKQIILEVRPDIMISHRRYLRGRSGMVSASRNEHDEAGFATHEAMYLASVPDPETKIAPHTVALTYYLGAFFETDEIDFYVDIGSWAEKRVQAEVLFTTQGHTEAFARKRVEISAGRAGWNSRTQYAEGFVRQAPELLDSLPVPQRALQFARGGRMDGLRRISGEDQTARGNH